jgi:hypothetical protein
VGTLEWALCRYYFLTSYCELYIYHQNSSRYCPSYKVQITLFNHSFTYRPSDSTVLEDVEIEPMQDCYDFGIWESDPVTTWLDLIHKLG